MKFVPVESPKKSTINNPWIAILGNPNCGKTALFNRLTGLHHKVGNYPGITVEKKHGQIRGTNIELHDMPGTYSLDAKSLDEQIVTETVQNWHKPALHPLAVIVVLDATNLSRSLFLALQILEYGAPTILAINMIDEARRQGITFDTAALKDKLGVLAVIETSAKTGEGIEAIINSINDIGLSDIIQPQGDFLQTDQTAHNILQPLEHFIKKHGRFRSSSKIQAIRLLSNLDVLSDFERQLPLRVKVELATLLEQSRTELIQQGINPASIESHARYAFIDDIADEIIASRIEQRSPSEKIDGVLTHPLWGSLTLIILLALVFNSIFTWATIPMSWIEAGIDWLGTTVHTLLPSGQINSLITDGIIAGVGNVVVFLPQIVLLIFFLSLLEDSGYMSRMAFILDKSLRKFGLHGKAVLPMLSGFACAIPAIMSARTIENRRDRLITILLIPLMSCSARLPVYTLLIAAFVPQRTLFGFLQLQSLVLLGAYFLGFFTALIASFMMKKISGRRHQSHFIMELPPYRLPLMRSVFYKVYDGAKLFLLNAGSIILAISIVLWFLASYPQPDANPSLTAKERIEQSYAGQIGHAIEPVIKPLGFDWKIGVGLLSSFAAREVIVSAFATLYNLEDDGEENISLVEALRHDRQPDGSRTYPPIVGISLLVFFVFAAQCMSTIAIVKRETNSWRWPIVMVLYMNVLAYLAAFIVYQGGTLLGVV